MCAALPQSPSLVEGASRIGQPERSRLLAASVTGVSPMLRSSFASVAPVQGATTMAVASFLGPSGSTPGKVSSTQLPVISDILFFQSCALPKRVSVPDA